MVEYSINRRPLLSGSKAQANIRILETRVSRILMFVWSFGPLIQDFSALGLVAFRALRVSA